MNRGLQHVQPVYKLWRRFCYVVNIEIFYNQDYQHTSDAIKNGRALTFFPPRILLHVCVMIAKNALWYGDFMTSSLQAIS